MTASAQFVTTHHCTASHPCVDICGDHVCAPGELRQREASSAQGPTNNATSTTPSTSTTSSPTEGIVVGGVMSYMDEASDGTAVILRTGHPLTGQVLSIGLAFKNANDSFVQHQNNAITVTQDNKTVLSNPMGHTHSGTDSLTTMTLSSSNPVDIKVILNGVGLPTADPSTWTGVKGEVLSFSQVFDIQAPSSTPIGNVTNATVPEFGSIAGVIIAISIIGSLVISRRFSVV